MKKISPATGVPILLMAFVVVFLLIFGVLSLKTSSNDFELTRKNREYVADYYAAEGKSQQLLARADRKIIEARNASKNNNAEFEDILKKSSDDEIKAVFEEKTLFLEWNVTLKNSNQIRERIQPLSAGSRRYKVVSHTIVSIKNWDGDDRHLEVFAG